MNTFCPLGSIFNIKGTSIQELDKVAMKALEKMLRGIYTYKNQTHASHSFLCGSLTSKVGLWRSRIKSI